MYFAAARMWCCPICTTTPTCRLITLVRGRAEVGAQAHLTLKPVLFPLNQRLLNPISKPAYPWGGTMPALHNSSQT